MDDRSVVSLKDHSHSKKKRPKMVLIWIFCCASVGVSCQTVQCIEMQAKRLLELMR
jgi:hypothetical protein